MSLANATDPGEAVEDRRQIMQLLENWAIWRDAGDWDAFRTVWYDDGRMTVTWCQASAEGFTEQADRGGIRR